RCYSSWIKVLTVDGEGHFRFVNHSTDLEGPREVGAPASFVGQDGLHRFRWVNRELDRSVFETSKADGQSSAGWPGQVVEHRPLMSPRDLTRRVRLVSHPCRAFVPVRLHGDENGHRFDQRIAASGVPIMPASVEPEGRV